MSISPSSWFAACERVIAVNCKFILLEHIFPAGCAHTLLHICTHMCLCVCKYVRLRALNILKTTWNLELRKRLPAQRPSCGSRKLKSGGRVAWQGHELVHELVCVYVQ